MGNEAISAAKRTSTCQAVFENSLVGIFTTAKDRTFSEVNGMAAAIFGYSPEELTGQSARLVHASDESFLRFGEEIIAALPERKVVRLHYHLLRKDGSLFLAEVSGSPLNGVDLEDGIVWVIADVTAQPEAEEELRRSQKRLGAVLETVQTGIAIVDVEKLEIGRVEPERRGGRSGLSVRSPFPLGVPQ
ncbi:MAG: PAS domain S-box protein [Gemmatimonadota bacterium]